VAYVEGDRCAAGEALRAALAQAEALGDAYLRVRAAVSLVLLELDEGDTEHARTILTDSLRLARQLTNPHYVAQALEGVAVFAAERSERAKRDAIRGGSGRYQVDHRRPAEPTERSLLDRHLRPEGLDASNLEVGRTWSVEQAVANALEFMSATSGCQGDRSRRGSIGGAPRFRRAAGG
jgi:ATP/maltotriose-dependent transcriptional regulator MalT